MNTNNKNKSNRKNKIHCIWRSICEFLNSTFAAWLFPSVIFTLIVLWYKECSNDAIKRDQAAQIVNEINTRIKFAKDRTDFCDQLFVDSIIKNNNYDYNIDYGSIFSNLLTSKPFIKNIDSIDYSSQFKDESLPNLINRLTLLDDRYDKEVVNISNTLKIIKDYYRAHKYIDNNTFFIIKGYVKDSLKEINRIKN